MNRRAEARHRAPLRPATPLTSLTTAVSGGIGRGGVVAAMSTGLIATFGLPSSQASQTARAAEPANTLDAESLAWQSSAARTQEAAKLLQLPAQAGNQSTPVTAAATAQLNFAGGTAFVAKAKPKAPAPKLELTAERSTRTSRQGSSDRPPATPPGSAVGSSVLAVAARYIGVPYLYGGTTPDGFDCSGYTRYVFAAVGISLPRTADQQMNATTRISAADARPGDMVFFVSGGRAYHNGIYAGNGMMYDSPKTGGYVSKRAIWSATIVFTRVTG